MEMVVVREQLQFPSIQVSATHTLPVIHLQWKRAMEEKVYSLNRCPGPYESVRVQV